MIRALPEHDGTGLGAESGPTAALTSGAPRIHCADTSEVQDNENELDRIAIDNFLDTLADVALSVARRKMDQDSEAGDVAA